MRDRISIVKQFKEALEYIRQSKKYIFAAIILMVLSGVFGFIFSSRLGFLDSYLNEIISKTQDFGALEFILFILQNNFYVALFAIIGGIVFGIFPIANSIVNGAVIGYVFRRVFDSVGVLELWRILPHGIFELPAI